MESMRSINIDKDYKVVVGCLTYNHSKYIVDALNGFAMQQTDFPFACIVMDDASTDGEPEVIKDWLQKECDMNRAEYYDLELANVVIAPHLKNANCTMAIYLLKRNLYEEASTKFDIVKGWADHCEYLALCEGDDYWIDSEKLQIQSDCLDTHPEVDMCSHSYLEKHAVSDKIIKHKYFQKSNCIIQTPTVISVEGSLLATDSIMLRKELFYSIPDFRRIMDYDYTLYIHGSLKGGIIYIHRYMSVYRRFVPGSWSINLASNEMFHKDFVQKRNYMLDILDKETGGKFHQCIQQRKMLNLLELPKTPVSKLKVVQNNKNLMEDLSLYEKSVIVCKCISPRLGHLIVNVFKVLNLTISYV